jgi:hypothetical protein
LDLIAPLKHCGLDWRYILEDYYEFNNESLPEDFIKLFDSKLVQDYQDLTYTHKTKHSK